ncbi:MAG: MotA/TolQ/ExbB proton channel family protein [Kiritimatiellae bacterium]|nr:MotA/TolQ/ExbB proton channel family protein [Kiritimatiellia bacterium]
MSHGSLVFWVIVCMGLATLVLFLGRLLKLRRAKIDYADFLKGVYNLLEKSRAEEAVVLCEETDCPVSAVILSALRHRSDPADVINQSVLNTERSELSRMERRLATILLCCQVAPLLGLIGTLLAMVSIINVLHNQTPLIQNADLTGGLAQAFSCTIAGLVVAVQCHAMYSILIAQIERIVLDMETCGSEIVAYLAHHQPAKR